MIYKVGSVVEWLKRRARDQHGLDLKATHAILLCPWERHFTAHSPAWWSWQAVLNYSNISIKLQAVPFLKIAHTMYIHNLIKNLFDFALVRLK